jgi:membrane-associated phospholipid phosphatase
VNGSKHLACSGRSYRALSQRLASRFGPATTFALSLACGFVALTVLTWLGAELVQKLLGALVSGWIDKPVVQYAAAHRVAPITGVMRAITVAGDDLSLWIAVLIGGSMLAWLTRSWRPLLLLALVMVGAESLNVIIKFAVARTRPPTRLWAITETSWSFPSGHALKSAAVYVTLAKIFASTEATASIKVMAYAIGLLAPFLIGISRVYLGVHWPTDVVSGWVLGCVWSAIVFGSNSGCEQDQRQIKQS